MCKTVFPASFENILFACLKKRIEIMQASYFQTFSTSLFKMFKFFFVKKFFSVKNLKALTLHENHNLTFDLIGLILAAGLSDDKPRDCCASSVLRDASNSNSCTRISSGIACNFLIIFKSQIILEIALYWLITITRGKRVALQIATHFRCIFEKFPFPKLQGVRMGAYGPHLPPEAKCLALSLFFKHSFWQPNLVGRIDAKAGTTLLNDFCCTTISFTISCLFAFASVLLLQVH